MYDKGFTNQMRLMTRLSALMGIMLLALTIGQSPAAAGAAGQDVSGTEAFDFGTLEGIQEAISRTYTVDFSAMMESIGTPGPNGEMGELPELTGVISLQGTVARFDSGDNAAAAVDTMDAELKGSLEGQDDAPELTEIEDLELGDKSKAYTASQEIEGQQTNLVVIIAQQDEFAYLTIGAVIDGDAQEVTKGLTQALIDNEAGDNAAAFSEDGTSTGGVWDKFPKADDELVADLTAFDQQVYPAPDGTSTPAS